MRTHVDKYAKLNPECNCILYTLRENPKLKRVVTLAEGKRITDELYG